MQIVVCKNKTELGSRAAEHCARLLRSAVDARGSAALVVATGASQFEVFAKLVGSDVPWNCVTGFHLDEYIGLAPDHRASFCGYLQERFVDRVPLKEFCFVDGLAADPTAECTRLSKLVRAQQIDVAMIGIGENGHLAFNDPPADFQTEEPFIVVQLDEACRRQQLGEGWFDCLEEVPTRAISMSIRQILKSSNIICSVPDERKACAVDAAVQGPISPDVPASILRTHSAATLYLDPPAASRLRSSDLEPSIELKG